MNGAGGIGPWAFLRVPSDILRVFRADFAGGADLARSGAIGCVGCCGKGCFVGGGRGAPGLARG